MMKWFRCTHKKTSLPIAKPRKNPETNRLFNTFVVCLKCGEQLPYSFHESRMVQDRRTARVDGERHGGQTSFA